MVMLYLFKSVKESPGGYYMSEEEICEFLLIDSYDFYEAVSNMVSPLYSLERNSIPWGDNRYV